MAEGQQTWTTIESDPGLFTELIERIGVSNVQVEELWSVDKDALQPLQPIHGLIFLFKYVKESDPRPIATDADHVFFANQVIPNACATQAILSVLLNSRVDLGTELSAFKDFTAGLPSDMAGLAISNSELIRTVHNSFTRPDPLMQDEDKESKDGDAFHFIAYVPKAAALYELDGLKPGPIKLADLEEGVDWTEAAAPAIQERMARYAGSEVRFNLMALVGDKRVALQEQIDAKSRQRDAITARLSGQEQQQQPQQPDEAAGGLAQEQLAAPQALQGLLPHVEAELTHLQDELADEHAKRAKWADENIRRRHSYIPFMFAMLRHLADQGSLGPLIEKARSSKGKEQQLQQQ